jgi:hypothetical protein
MRHHPSRRNIVVTVFFSILAVLFLNACSDANNVTGPPPPAEPGLLTILTPSPLPGVAQNQAYTVALSASGGTPGYTWSLAAGSPLLPTGLTLSPGGIVSGSPTSLGTVDLIIKVQDSATPAQSTQKTLSITVSIAPIPLQITSTALSSGTINVSYFAALTGTGGTTPYTWGLKSGLPPGLTLDSANGFIQGTPTQTSSAPHIFTLKDAALTTVERSLTLTIRANPLSITTTSLPQGTANQNYSAQLAASGGTGAYAWGFAGGSPVLPTGLTLNTSSGLISGNPTRTSNNNYTFTVTDQTPPTRQTATKTLQLIIGAAPPTLAIDPNSLPSGTVFQPYNFTLTASGGTGTKTWDIVSGSLPAGFNPLSSTGVISGTTNSRGTTSATFRVRDSGNPQQTATKPLSITIGLPAPPIIQTTSLPNATFNVAYNQTLGITGGTPPLVWGVISGTLPAGLSITSNQISFTPTATGSFTFTVRVTDATNQFDDQPLTLNIVAPPPPTINSFTLPTGTVNQPYPNTQLTAAPNGALPYTWTVTPALAGGTLTLNLSTGVIIGTPTQGTNGVTTHTFRVTDSTLPIHQFGELTRTLTINANVTPVSITTTSLPSGTVGQSYTAPLLAASEGTSPYNWSNTTAMPPGLSVGADGAITGTPTATNTNPTTFKVLDSTVPNQQSATKSLTITITAAPPPLTITTTSPLPVGKVGDDYGTVTPAGPVTLTASGGTPPYTWSTTVSPPLPSGLSIDAAGTISGTPTVDEANISHTFTVADSASTSVNKVLSLTIAP